MELAQPTKDPANDSWDPDVILHHAAKMTQVKNAIHEKARVNIGEAQKRDKLYYDRKHADNRVSVDSHRYTSHNTCL